MGLTVNGRNERLNDMAADYTTMSLHTADPGETGASEVTGGSPAYARIASIAWNAASNGSITMSSVPVFNVPGAVTVAYVGFWKGAVFQAGYALTTAQAFSYQGTLTFDSYTISQPA